MDKNGINILIAGVGGQGTVLTGRVLGRFALASGLDCKLSEVHGMSQRGGSVVTHVRMGEKIYSPVIWEGGADVILAYEKLEAVRVSHFLKPNGHMIINSVEIQPMPCISGMATYPDNIQTELLSEIKNAHFIKASEIAQNLGSVKAQNIVLLGAMCKLCELDYNIMKQSVEDCVPSRFLELNTSALEKGFNY